MASEIRVNKIENRSGLGTVTFADTGVDLAGIVTATTFSGSGASLTALPAGNLTGTVADARFPATLPAISALNLTNVPAANVVGVHTSLNITGSTTTGTAVVGGGVTISESGIEASGIGITCANINGGSIGGRRNLIINGAMNVAQRGISSTTDGYLLDRFNVEDGNEDEACTREQAAVTSGGAYNSGFRNCLKITNGNQTGGAGATDYIQIMYRAEAQDIANSGWNFTSSSSFITLSFWVKTSVAQAFSGSLRTSDGTSYSYKFDTPSISANTWTKVIKTIPGNSNLTFADDNGVGLSIYLYAYLGTTYTSSNANTETWITAATDTYSNDMTSTWWTTNDATFEITGVQLEVGPEATAFEHLSFGEELSLCQRYFQKYTCSAQEWIYVESDNASHKWWQTYFNPMRAQPTVDVSDLSTGSGATAAGSGGATVSSVSLVSSSSSDSVSGRSSFRVTFSGTWGSAYSVAHIDAWSGDSVTFSSEL